MRDPLPQLESEAPRVGPSRCGSAAMVTAMKVHSLAFSLAAMVLSAVGARLSAEVGSPEYRLVLTDGSTLKAVFDAGLRPRRWPDRLQHVCRTGRVSLRLTLAGRRDFAFEAESTEMPRKNGPKDCLLLLVETSLEPNHHSSAGDCSL